MRSPLRLRTLLAALALLGTLLVSSAPTLTLAQSTPVSEASPAATDQDTFSVTGFVNNPGDWTVADLAQFPAQTVEVTFESGDGTQTHTFTGVLLSDVIASAELAADPDGPKNAILRTWLVFTASDGYQVVISGGEFDPGFGNNPLLLAWEMDGAPLSAEDGPVRLVVPGDVRGGRYISGIDSIEVVSLDPAE